MKRFLIPIVVFMIGSTLIASFYIGILTWAQGWHYASSQFVRDRWYVIPIIFGFGVQAALYSILRFRLFIPITSTTHAGTIMGTSGGKFSYPLPASVHARWTLHEPDWNWSHALRALS